MSGFNIEVWIKCMKDLIAVCKSLFTKWMSGSLEGLPEFLEVIDIYLDILEVSLLRKVNSYLLCARMSFSLNWTQV